VLTSFRCAMAARTTASHLQHLKNEWESNQFLLERVYGTAAAWERRMDRAVLAQVARLPGGPPSSFAGLDTLLGRDDRVTVEDILYRACHGWPCYCCDGDRVCSPRSSPVPNRVPLN